MFVRLSFPLNEGNNVMNLRSPFYICSINALPLIYLFEGGVSESGKAGFQIEDNSDLANFYFI